MSRWLLVACLFGFAVAVPLTLETSPPSIHMNCWKFCGLVAAQQSATLSDAQLSQCCERVSQRLPGLDVAFVQSAVPAAPALKAAVPKVDVAPKAEAEPKTDVAPKADAAAPSTVESKAINLATLNIRTMSQVMEPTATDFGAPQGAELLIGVTSSPNHFDHRQSIRDSWLKYLFTDSCLSRDRAQRTSIKFIVGPMGPQTDPAIRSRFQDEVVTHSDIVVIPGFVEDYSNLTLKTFSMMEYAVAKGYKALFKTDDDSYVQVDQLWNQIDRYPNVLDAFTGHCSKNFNTPMGKNKNYMGDTWDHPTIPQLCHGGGYLVGGNIMRKLVARKSSLTFHRNEDAAMSIWIMNEPSVPGVYYDGDMPVTFYIDPCKDSSVYLNPIALNEQRLLWDNVKMRRGVCADGFQLQEYVWSQQNSVLVA